MTNELIEQKLKHCFSGLAPDSLPEDVVNACSPSGSKPKANIRLLYWFAAVAAVFALVVVGGVMLRQPFKTPELTIGLTSTVISLDVNPSVNIEVDETETVLSVTPLNDDGKIIVGDADYTGKTLDETVESLVNAMVQNGYLSELANSLLVSVNDEDSEKASLLQAKISAAIDALLKSGDFEGAILSQTVATDNGLKELADTYGISLGKAQLINRIIERDPMKTFDALAPMSINELNLLVAKLNADVKATGTASDKAYIGAEAAQDIALRNAAATVETVTGLSTELDCEHGVMCYEVEFCYNGTEYEYEIDALTGDILDCEQEADEEDETDDDEWDEDEVADDKKEDRQENTTVSTSFITEDAAKAAAFAHAGVAQADVSDCKCELDKEDGAAVYEIDWQCGNTDYEYVVDAVTGDILDCKREADEEDETDDDEWDEDEVADDKKEDRQENTTVSTSFITEDAAKAAAFAHAGVAQADVSDCECELDKEDGAAVYEIDWQCGNTDYEYVVDAVTGDILVNHTEADD